MKIMMMSFQGICLQCLLLDRKNSSFLSCFALMIFLLSFILLKLSKESLYLFSCFLTRWELRLILERNLGCVESLMVAVLIIYNSNCFFNLFVFFISLSFLESYPDFFMHHFLDHIFIRIVIFFFMFSFKLFLI